MHHSPPLDPSALRDQPQIRRELDRLERTLAAATGRIILGITGAPGAGKSTLANLMAQHFGDRAAVVPMDGFHLSDRVLAAHGAVERKGAIDTFDADGYVALLRRLSSNAGRPVFAPRFERDLEEPIAAGIEVPPEARLIITEGNYLLAEAPPWLQLREICAEIWFLDPPAHERMERLVARHERFGKSPEAARAWAAGTDEANARFVEGTKVRANLIIPWG